MQLQTKGSVPKLLFVLFVSAVVIAPRLPLDEPCTIGGNLSRSFRKILLWTTISYFFRNIVLTDEDFGGMGRPFELFLMASEGVMLCFLSLLTPYLLRTWLQTRINLGRPGKTLQPWVYAFATLNTMAVVARIATGKHDFLIFKKIADTVSFVPVRSTLLIYNRVTNSQTRYSGRGSILSRVVMIAEYFALFINAADTASKLCGLLGLLPEESNFIAFIKQMHGVNLYASYSRILCHGILLNVLDEAYTIGSTASSGDEENGFRSHRPSREAAHEPRVTTHDIQLAHYTAVRDEE